MSISLYIRSYFAANSFRPPGSLLVQLLLIYICIYICFANSFNFSVKFTIVTYRKSRQQNRRQIPRESSKYQSKYYFTSTTFSALDLRDLVIYGRTCKFFYFYYETLEIVTQGRKQLQDNVNIFYCLYWNHYIFPRDTSISRLTPIISISWG